MIAAWAQLRELGNKLRQSGNAQERQEAWLLDCLSRNRDTAYGRQFGFDRMCSVKEYQAQVPLVVYENLASRIMQVEQGDGDVLFAGQPIAFERTGGSTGGSKLIPYTANSLLDFRRAILPWLADASLDFDLNAGCAYWAISPATRKTEFTFGGAPVGLPDGAYLGDEALPAFAALSAVPHWLGGIPQVADWQRATLYWLIRRNDLALISVWSPTFLLGLLESMHRHADVLDRLLRQGGEIHGQVLPADPAAAERLASYLKEGDTKVLWPDLKLVSCWADASSLPFFQELKLRLSHASFQGKGLLATEGVVTIPSGDGYPLLASDSGFFEFLDKNGASRLAQELEDDARYEVVMTTSGGLYRYRTGDCVVCKGYSGTIPKLKFVGRYGLVSDLVGEKLTEEFVADCLDDIPGFRMLVPKQGLRPGYVLVLDARNHSALEGAAGLVEDRLRKNPQYAYARDIGQLGAVELLFAREPLDGYIMRIVNQGVRMGDVKIPALRPGSDWLTTFRGV